MQRFLMSPHSTRLLSRLFRAPLWRWLLVLCALPTLLGSRGAQAHPAAQTALERAMQLADSVPPPVLSGAARLVHAAPGEANQPLTLTVVLRRTDEVGFEQYLAGVQDPHSPSYEHFLTQEQLAAQFGPSQDAYETVLAWLLAQGFTLVQGSANRLTLTVKGTRQQAEAAFKVSLGDYRLGKRVFYANAEDPTIPASLAGDVLSVMGLSNLAQPLPPAHNIQGVAAVCGGGLVVSIAVSILFLGILIALWPAVTWAALCIGPMMVAAGVAGLCAVGLWALGSSVIGQPLAKGCLHTLFGDQAAPSNRAARSAPARAQATIANAAANSSSQKIGLLEYDAFHSNDITNWLALVGGNPTLAGQLSEVNVNGGVSSPGSGESEVLLDIESAMLFDPSPATSYVVYDASPSTSFAQLFNTMINDGDTVISNSWSQCEDQTSLAEAQSIDAVLAQAAASGISVFNGSGDTGSTCLDGSPNTIGVPADSPHATAVGGTTPTLGPGLTYGGETWWNGANQNPPTGQGGYGVSRYFTRPAYQNGLTNSPMRSVPDLAVIADPRDGLAICQADAGGCPDGLMHGGTSMAAPEMAAETAMLNQSLGHNVGEVNPVLYPLASTPNAFHTAATMGSDFAHVGLGDPDLDYIRLALSHQTIGPASPSLSLAAATGPNTTHDSASADGTTQGIVQVNLIDDNDYPVAGKTVTLTPNAGSHAVVSAASGPSSVNGGAVTFTVTDTVPETVTFTVKDTTDNITLNTQPSIVFVPPPATGGSIEASPSQVPADGSSQATVTVTLQNAKGQGAQGKTILLSQGSGHAVLTGSGVTDASGRATFQVIDLTVETVTFTAVDVTDGNLPVPGSAQVDFTAGTGTNNCPLTTPTAGTGFAVAPYATGFYDGTAPHLIGCGGPTRAAFDASGNAYIGDLNTGDIFKFGSAGGAATGTTKITTTPLGSWLNALAFGKNGVLYALQSSVPGDPLGDASVYQIDPATGAIVRTVADNLYGAGVLAVDPISGDLFLGNDWNGYLQGSDIVRIHDAGSSTPIDCTNFQSNTSAQGCWVYASPGSIEGLSFDPDGNLYVRGAASTGPGNDIWIVSATNSAQPGTVIWHDTSIPGGGGIAILRPEANGKRAVVVLTDSSNNGGLDLVDLSQSPLQPVRLVNSSTIGFSGAYPGPDGCIYFSAVNSVYKVTNADGSCPFNPATGVAPALHLSPGAITPNPGTGSPVTFTATLANVSNPQGTPILVAVGGANPQVKLVHADANGQATFTYTGVLTGTDQITASATLTSTTTITPTTLTSNVGQVTWAAGKHVSFASLNLSPTGGLAGAPVTLKASLTDISAQPPSPIAGAALTIQLGAQSCQATTDSAGNGSCSIIPNETGGSYPLTASYAGDGQHTPATASASFVVIGAAQLQLQPGWNLIDLPLTPTSPISASTVLAGTLQSGGHLAALFALKGNQWTPSLIQQAGKPAIGQDFPLQPGVGYLLYSDQNATYREAGTVPVPPPTWSVTQGWNLVGLSFGATGVISASTVLAELGQRGVQLAALYGLSHGQWTPSLIQLSSGAQIGHNFALQPGVGYLLYSDTTVPGFTPSASLPATRAVPFRRPLSGGPSHGRFPPLPPLPPVARTGPHS